MFLGNDSLATKTQLSIGNKIYNYFSLRKAEAIFPGISRLPCSLKILLENLLRCLDNKTVTIDDIKAIATWSQTKTALHEIAFRPARVLMQDFTGVPAIVDLAAMRHALNRLNGKAEKISPLSKVDLVIDHSIVVDTFATPDAFITNTMLEMQRNKERYAFLRWGQKAFANFSVVPPGTGICHQVNLEYLAQTIFTSEINGVQYAYPDTLLGTDSHTTMVNSLGVLGWGVGGIEAEAAMLGQPVSMLIPEVIGCKLIGELREGITATDLVLTITQILRSKGVVGKFVEFYGSGLAALSLADRATVANMAPEYGATCGFFPVDAETLKYLKLTGRKQQAIDLVEIYCKEQGIWHDPATDSDIFTDTITLNLRDVEASLSGPRRPQDKVTLASLPIVFDKFLKELNKEKEKTHNFLVPESNFNLQHGQVVIAAITSCTNTSNPNVLIAAGLLAKKAIAKGLQRKPWVKTSFAPGSKVVVQYLQQTGLQQYLDALGFNLVGYGCTTCIGNSGPLPPAIAKTIKDNDLVVSAVLSGNRNFEGRIHPQVRANWLASPPLVVAYALYGSISIDLNKEPLGHDSQGNAIFLRDIWPTAQEIASCIAKITSKMFRDEYQEVFKGDKQWQTIQVSSATTYNWDPHSTYIKHPPFFENITQDLQPIKSISKAYILALLGDSITTDHISPAGFIKGDSPAGIYLKSQGVAESDFNSYGSRRGNHEVMMRGTFANIRIHNEMADGNEGGVTKHIPSKKLMAIYDAAMLYKQAQTDLIVIAGKEYGTGSSRDWAAKGPKLLGIKAVIAESFERIHRSNLIGMGILPLEFTDNMNRLTLQLQGTELISIENLDKLTVAAMLNIVIERANSDVDIIKVRCRIDTNNELEYYRHGGILNYMLRQLI